MGCLQRLAVLLVGLSMAAQTPPPVTIGATIDAEFTDLHWQRRSLAELDAPVATVIYFATVECPLVRRYMPAVGELALSYANRGVVTLVVNVGTGDAFVDAAAPVVEHAPSAVFGWDASHDLARACGIARTGTVVVLDGGRKLRYRGRLDDLHGLAGSRSAPTREDLRLALEELLAGRPIEVSETTVAGCLLTPLPTPSPGRVPTYSGDVAPILTRHCLRCHRDDANGAMALAREEDVRKHAAMMVEVTQQGRMPPWFAGPVDVPFQNRRGLSLAQRETIRAWFAGGMPGGEPVEERRHPMRMDWRVGAVDLVVDASHPIKIPASGALPYQYVEMQYEFAEETWVEAIEIRPQATRVLHHCNLAVVRRGEAFTPTHWLTNYTPHGGALVCPPGVAVRIPARSRLVLQAYYVPNGREVIDRPQVGMRFPKAPVHKQARVLAVGSESFEIPAGARAHRVSASTTVPDNAVGLALFAHLHVRGRDVTVVALSPEGSRRTLLLVPNYNFGMQEMFLWPREAMALDKGTTIEVKAHFDNSPWNPANPDHARVARPGPAIDDESLQVALVWYGRDDHLGIVVDPATGRREGSSPK